MGYGGQALPYPYGQGRRRLEMLQLKSEML
jgi:hypothetical protein